MNNIHIDKHFLSEDVNFQTRDTISSFRQIHFKKKAFQKKKLKLLKILIIIQKVMNHILFQK